MKIFKGKRVFISGGAGVIGTALVHKMHECGAIILVGDLKPFPKDFPPQVQYRQGDLNYITQEEIDRFEPEYFFHLAATFERSIETFDHWEENFQHNVRLSNHLITLMRNVGSLKRVIYASSYLIYDKALYNFSEARDKPVKLKETDPIHPRNLTGMAKLAHEIELDFMSRHNEDRYTAVSVRIYRGYGKNSRDIISRWVRSCLKGESLTVYREEGWFDYIYAEDSAEGLARIGATSFAGVVNLGSGHSRRVADVIGILKQHFPNVAMIKGETDIPYEASQADMEKFQSITDWTPTWTLENAVAEMIKYEHKVSSQEIVSHVMVTSLSKKIPLIRELKRAARKLSSDIKVIGADIDRDCLGTHFVDGFWVMPGLTDLSVDQLLSYCRENNIGSIIPTRDGELEFFSSIKEELAQEGISVMVSDPQSVENCIDKLKFAQLKAVLEIPCIKTSEKISELDASKFVVKERFGAGARKIGLKLDRVSADKHAEGLSEPIFQPFIDGKEYSVDAYIDVNGLVKGLIVRERVEVIDGESQVTSTIRDEELEDELMNIIKKLNLYGHIVLQVIIDSDRQIHLIECNARFGGASTASLAAGLDSFYWFLLESQGTDIEQYPFYRSRKEITQVRYPCDHIL